MERNALASAVEIGSTSSSGGGTLIHRATAGATTHSAAKGIAAHKAAGRATARTNNTAKAIRTLATIRKYVAKSFRSTPCLACAAVTHCSRLWRVKNKRISVRTIASVISHAWYAIKVIVKPICDAPSDKSDSTSRKWLRLETPLSREFSPTKKGISAGIEIVARTKRVHIQGDTCGTSHPVIMTSSMNGAESVRRRLSSIFQRLIAGIEILRRSSFDRPPRPKIHGSNCQSPRAQRCCRAAATS